MWQVAGACGCNQVAPVGGASLAAGRQVEQHRRRRCQPAATAQIAAQLRPSQHCAGPDVLGQLQQQQAGEGKEQQRQEQAPAGEKMEEQSPAATASGRGEAGWQQAQQPAAAAAGIMRQQSLKSTTSSLSFTG